MNIIDVYTKKEYECKKCKAPIYYGKVTDDSGNILTNDGRPPNGKFGKESNVISGAVDAHVQDRLHGCTEKFVLQAVQDAKKNKGSDVKREAFEFTLTADEKQLYGDIVSKVCEYDILADNIIETYPCDQSGQSRGRIKNIAAQVLRDILEARRNEGKTDE